MLVKVSKSIDYTVIQRRDFTKFNCGFVEYLNKLSQAMPNTGSTKFVKLRYITLPYDERFYHVLHICFIFKFVLHLSMERTYLHLTVVFNCAT